MNKISFVLVLAFLCGAAPCRGAGSAGANPFNVLLVDGDARAVGMAGAYTALARGSSGLLYNPGGLGMTGRYEATFMHNQYFQGINQEYLAIAAPAGWAANLTWMGLDSVQRTTISNPDGNGLGQATSNDFALSGGYGRTVGSALSLGVSAKVVRESLDGTSGQGYAADFGALYAVPLVPGLTFGAAVQNIGPAVKYQNASENLPLNVRAGTGYEFKLGDHATVLALDVAKERSTVAVIAAGAEFSIAKALPVRVGFTSRNSAGPGVTAGVGYAARNVQLDYAFEPYGDLGFTNRVSATLRWGGAPSMAARDSLESDTADLGPAGPGR